MHAAPQINPDPEGLLTENMVAELLSVSTRTLQSWRHRGIGPDFLKIGPRGLRYRRGDVTAWTQSRIVTSTSDQRQPTL